MKSQKILLSVFLTIFAGVLPFSSSFAGDKGISTVKVIGISSINVTADVAYIVLYANGEGKKLEEAMSKASQKSQNLNKILKQKFSQIKVIDIKTIHIGEKQMDYRRPDIDLVPSVPQVFKQIMITIEPDPEIIEQVVDLAIENKTYIELPRNLHMSPDRSGVVVYGLLETEKIETEISKKAIEDAQRRAKIISKNTHQKLGKISSIEVNWGSDILAQRYIYRNKPSYQAKYISKDNGAIEVMCIASVEFELD